MSFMAEGPAMGSATYSYYQSPYHARKGPGNYLFRPIWPNIIFTNSIIQPIWLVNCSGIAK